MHRRQRESADFAGGSDAGSGSAGGLAVVAGIVAVAAFFVTDAWRQYAASASSQARTGDALLACVAAALCALTLFSAALAAIGASSASAGVTRKPLLSFTVSLSQTACLFFALWLKYLHSEADACSLDKPMCAAFALHSVTRGLYPIRTFWNVVLPRSIGGRPSSTQLTAADVSAAAAGQPTDDDASAPSNASLLAAGVLSGVCLYAALRVQRGCSSVVVGLLSTAAFLAIERLMSMHSMRQGRLDEPSAREGSASTIAAAISADNQRLLTLKRLILVLMHICRGLTLVQTAAMVLRSFNIIGMRLELTIIMASMGLRGTFAVTLVLVAAFVLEDTRNLYIQAHILQLPEIAKSRISRHRMNVLKYIGSEMTVPLYGIHVGIRRLMQLAEKMPADCRDIAQQIWSAEVAMGVFQKDCLDMLKLNFSTVSWLCTPTRIADAVRQAVGQLQPFADSLGVDLVCEIVTEPCNTDSWGSGYFLVDNSRFMMVLASLIHNAIKFTGLSKQAGVEAGAGSPGMRRVSPMVGVVARVEMWMDRSSGTATATDAVWRVSSVVPGVDGIHSQPGDAAWPIEAVLSTSDVTGSPHNNISEVSRHQCLVPSHAGIRPCASSCPPSAVLAPSDLGGFEVRLSGGSGIGNDDDGGDGGSGPRKFIRTGRAAIIGVTVCDTGPGIPQQDLQHAFLPFHQIEAGGAEKGSSTGLGLSMARELITRHGGSIGVLSTEGEFADFFTRWPLHEVAPMDDARQATSAPSESEAVPSESEAAALVALPATNPPPPPTPGAVSVSTVSTSSRAAAHRNHEGQQAPAAATTDAISVVYDALSARDIGAAMAAAAVAAYSLWHELGASFCAVLRMQHPADPVFMSIAAACCVLSVYLCGLAAILVHSAPSKKTKRAAAFMVLSSSFAAINLLAAVLRYWRASADGCTQDQSVMLSLMLHSVLRPIFVRFGLRVTPGAEVDVEDRADASPRAAIWCASFAESAAVYTLAQAPTACVDTWKTLSALAFYASVQAALGAALASKDGTTGLLRLSTPQALRTRGLRIRGARRSTRADGRARAITTLSAFGQHTVKGVSAGLLVSTVMIAALVRGGYVSPRVERLLAFATLAVRLGGALVYLTLHQIIKNEFLEEVLAVEAHNKAKAARKGIERHQSDLLRYVVHEMRVPFSCIRLGLTVIEESRDRMPHELIDAADHIARSCDVVETILTDCAGMLKSQSFGPHIRPENRNVMQMLALHVQDLQPFAADSGVQLDLEVVQTATGSLDWGTSCFMVDHTRMLQIISAVVANAIHNIDVKRKLTDGESASHTGASQHIAISARVDMWLRRHSDPSGIQQHASPPPPATWIVTAGDASMVGEHAPLSTAADTTRGSGDPDERKRSSGHAASEEQYRSDSHRFVTCDPAIALAPVDPSHFTSARSGVHHESESLSPSDSNVLGGSGSNSDTTATRIALARQHGVTVGSEGGSQHSTPRSWQSQLTGRAAVIEFRVSHHGAAISETCLASLFTGAPDNEPEPLQHLSNADAASGGSGSDVGGGATARLELARELVVMMGGCFGVRSTDKGTSVLIRLPLLEAEGSPDTAPGAAVRTAVRHEAAAGEHPSVLMCSEPVTMPAVDGFHVQRPPTSPASASSVPPSLLRPGHRLSALDGPHYSHIERLSGRFSFWSPVASQMAKGTMLNGGSPAAGESVGGVTTAAGSACDTSWHGGGDSGRVSASDPASSSPPQSIGQPSGSAGGPVTPILRAPSYEEFCSKMRSSPALMTSSARSSGLARKGRPAVLRARAASARKHIRHAPASAPAPVAGSAGEMYASPAVACARAADQRSRMIMRCAGGSADATSLVVERVPEQQQLPAVRMLVVDDVPSARKLLIRTLQLGASKIGEWSCSSIDEAGNGLQAFEMYMQAMAAGRPYDVIAMDKEMPVMDGYEATRRIRAAESASASGQSSSSSSSSGSQPPPHRALIIACTGNALQNDQDQFISHGVDSVLVKPIRWQTFCEQVSSMLRRRAASSHHESAPPLP